MEYLTNIKYFEMDHNVVVGGEKCVDDLEDEIIDDEIIDEPAAGDVPLNSSALIQRSSNEIADISLRDFILRDNPTLSPKFIDEFVVCLQDIDGCVIDLDKAMQWIGFARKDVVKRMLTTKFKANTDYKTVKGASKFGKETILLSVDCFKDLAQQAPSEKGREVRDYYRKMEKSYIKFIKFQTDQARKKIDDLKIENEAAVKKLSRYVYQPVDKIYILEELSLDETCSETGEPYYKIGKAKDIKKRRGSYQTGRIKKVNFLYEKKCIDCNFIESMIKRILRGYEYEAGREIYGVKLSCLKEIINSCCNFLELMIKYNQDVLSCNPTVILPEFKYDKIVKEGRIKENYEDDYSPFPWMDDKLLTNS